MTRFHVLSIDTTTLAHGASWTPLKNLSLTSGDLLLCSITTFIFRLQHLSRRYYSCRSFRCTAHGSRKLQKFDQVPPAICQLLVPTGTKRTSVPIGLRLCPILDSCFLARRSGAQNESGEAPSRGRYQHVSPRNRFGKNYRTQDGKPFHQQHANLAALWSLLSLAAGVGFGWKRHPCRSDSNGSVNQSYFLF